MNMSIPANSFENFTDKEWVEISKNLQKYHSIFYKFWLIGRPIFTNSIPTAAVAFNKDGACVKFLFNKDFWNSISDYKKLFVICHECLHVVLNHGARFKNISNHDIANCAEDISINHMLVENFGFIREEIEGWEEYCWVETVFKDKKYRGLPYPTDESSEFYYNHLEKLIEETKNKSNKNGGSNSQDNFNSNENSQNSDNGGLPTLVDVHTEWQNATQSEIKEAVQKVVESMSDEEKRTLKNKISDELNSSKTAGIGSILAAIDLSHIKNIKKKSKWETVIKKWTSYMLTEKDHMEEQWLRQNRRLANFASDLMLPSDHEVEDLCYEKDKIKLFFFLDTSGSCINLAERFFKAAMSLNKNKFDIRLFCFDTCVAETTLASRTVYGGGGTSFSCIEDKIQEIIQSEKSKYPHAVFVITDGCGTPVTPAKPEKWFWFLTEMSNINYIPKQSRTFNLQDFE